jgi:hypothetical protein
MHHRLRTVALLLTLSIVNTPVIGDTEKTKPALKSTVPTDVIRDVDLDSIVKATRPKMQIVEAGTPIALSITDAMLQGVGDVKQYELSTAVTVENPDTEMRNFRVLTEINGTVRDRSGLFAIGSEQSVRKNLRIDFSLERGSVATLGITGTSSPPVKLVLVDQNGREHDRVARNIDYSRVRSASTTPTVREDLRVYRLRAELQSPTDRSNPSRDWSIKATLRVENTGTDIWNDAASVSVHYFRGRRGRLTRLDGLTGTTMPVPTGIRSSEYREMEVRTPRLLTPGSWYTAEAILNSRDDGNAGNNSVTYEFYIYDH